MSAMVLRGSRRPAINVGSLLERKTPNGPAEDHSRRGARLSPRSAPGQVRRHADQAADHPARSEPGLFARRRGAVPEAIAATPETIYDYTDKGNMVAVISNGTAVLGLGNLGAAGVQAGDGRQGGAVQAVRRHRRHRSRGRHRGPDEIHQLRALTGADLRRHQPGRHQGAGVLHHRAAPQGADGHSGLPRRPARHRDHHRRRAHQRAAHDRQEDRGRARWCSTAPARPGSPASS